MRIAIYSKIQEIGKHYCLAFTLVLFTVSGSAQDQWQIVYNDDYVETGTVHMLGYNDKAIKFEPKGKSNWYKIPSDELKEIILILDGQDTFNFVKMPYKYYGFSKKKMSTLKRKAWVTKHYSNDVIEAYWYLTKDTTTKPSGAGGNLVRSYSIWGQAIRIIPNDYVFNIGTFGIPGNGKLAAAQYQKFMNMHIRNYTKQFCQAFSSSVGKRTYELGELEKVVDDYGAKCK